MVTEWIAQHDLIVKNKGDKPVFKRHVYGSILNFTLVTGMNRKKTAN